MKSWQSYTSVSEIAVLQDERQAGALGSTKMSDHSRKTIAHWEAAGVFDRLRALTPVQRLENFNRALDLARQEPEGVDHLLASEWPAVTEPEDTINL